MTCSSARRSACRSFLRPATRSTAARAPSYSSYVIVRARSPFRAVEDLRGARAVVNSWTSHSGSNALRHRVAPLAKAGRFFGSVRESASHELSLRLIGTGEADVACVDCVSFGLLMRHRPRAIEGTRILESTPRVAAPPFVTSATMSLERVSQLRAALRSALVRPDLERARAALRRPFSHTRASPPTNRRGPSIASSHVVGIG